MSGNATLESNRPLVEPDPLWRRLLEQAVRDAGAKGKAHVAVRLGISRPYVSRVMSGDIYPVPQSFVDRVIRRLYVVAECPVSGLPQPRSECERLSRNPAPTHNPLAMRFWKCCQTCSERPAPKEQP